MNGRLPPPDPDFEPRIFSRCLLPGRLSAGLPDWQKGPMCAIICLWVALCGHHLPGLSSIPYRYA